MLTGIGRNVSALYSVWEHPFMVLAYISLASSLVLILRIGYSFWLSKKFAQHQDQQNGSSIRSHISALGGPTIFAYSVARTLSVFALLGLSGAVLLSDQDKTKEDQRLDLALCLVYVRTKHASTQHSCLLLRSH